MRVRHSIMSKWALGLVLSVATSFAADAQEISFSAHDASENLTNRLRGASLLLSLDAEETSAPQDYIAAARADYRRILTALYASGHYGGTVSISIDGREAASIAPLDAPISIRHIEINIQRGPEFSFQQTQISPIAENTVLPDAFAPGEIARSDVIRQSVNTAISAWQDIGYAKAHTESQQITARHDNQQLDVFVTLAPGAKFTFGNLTVRGSENVRTERVIEIAGLPSGETYSPDAIAQAEQRLRRTGAFDSVAMIEAENGGPENTLPITVQLVDSKPRRFGFGLELSSVEGLRVSSFWLHRNFLGGAERLRVEGEISGIGGETGGIDYSLTTSFNRPATFGPDTDLFVSAAISHEEEPDYILNSAEVEIGLSRIVSEDLTAEAGFGILTAREETALGVRNYTLFTVPLRATLDRRDDPVNAQNGYYLDIAATPFVGLSGGPNGGRIYSDLRGFRSFGEDDRFTFAARLQIGSVMGATIDNAPADFLFYSGGGGTVRGQPYKSLGIETLTGMDVQRTGGLSFAGAQMESRFDVTENIGLVGFYDVGYVGTTSTPGTDGGWQSGAGFGVRYQTGIGPIRLDIGTPANGPDAGKSVQVYIGIGQSF